MSLRRYDYYPASPQAIRNVATRARTGSGQLHKLVGQVGKDHRGAVSMTEGDLTGMLNRSVSDPRAVATGVNRRALWSALQLEVFADAIETYNRESPDPMAIERLNKEVDRAASPLYLCVSVPGPDAGPAERQTFNQQMQQRQAEIQSNLDEHFRRLQANLDAAATGAAQALKREPTDQDIIAAWKAGNLPAYAVQVWPTLGLNCIPINGVDEYLLGLTEQQVIDRLRDHTKVLSDAEREWLMVSYPDAMRRFSEGWTLDNAVMLPPGQPPAGHESESAEHGWIQGPDGSWYPIQIPQRPPLPPGAIASVGESSGSLYSGNGSWVTLDSRQGPIAAGEPLVIIPFLGGSPQLYGDQSVGENQTDYLTYDQYGNVVTHQQAPDRPVPWGIPASVPEPELSDAPPGTFDPGTMDNPKLDRLNTASTIGDVVIGTLEGIQLNNQLEANRHFAGNISFQASGDERRAVIQLAQLQYNQDDGKVIPYPMRTYGVIDEDGGIEQPSR
jgi:hypothetical protein